MTAARQIYDWQQRFRAAPSVWAVFDPDDCLTNIYATREAAELEVRWERARGHRRYGVRQINIHSIELAQERWTTRHWEKP